MSEANAVSNNNGNVWTQALLLGLVNLINYMDRYTVSGRALPKIISFLYNPWPMSVGFVQEEDLSAFYANQIHWNPSIVDFFVRATIVYY